MMKSILEPTKNAERIQALDFLRGFAILGILIMNIQSFSMIEAAYMNPSAFGDLTGLNKIIWLLSHIFADTKFITIFSILFGAGIMLFTEKAEATGKSAAGLHYRRTFWLLIIGLVHAYAFWYGDIFVTYSLCVFIAFLFRKRKAKTLLIVGIILILIPFAFYIFSGLSMPYWPKQSVTNLLRDWQPSSEMIVKEISIYQGSWLEQMERRIPSALKFQTMVFFIYTGWRTMGLILIGMALYKWGVVSAAKSKKFYTNGILIGLVIGLPVVIYGMTTNVSAGFDVKYSMFLGSLFNYAGGIFIAAAYICIIMIASKSGHVGFFKKSFAGIGRTALTNYLLQTFICTTLFYGHGFGLFGQVERWMQFILVILIWIFQIMLTKFWISRFKFGPVEWLWRSLTYLKLQPIK